jgi:hypothetical protein
VEEEKKADHRRALLKDRVKYTTKKDLYDPDADQRALVQSSSLAFNSTFSLNGFERNYYFENRRDSFEELGAISGIDSDIDARSFGVGDLDGDGDLDLVVKNLQRRLLQYFRNDMREAGRADYHRVRFEFVGSRSNRDGIGTRVEIRHGDRFQMAEVRSASGFQSQSPNQLFFGLGTDERVSRVDVFWPSGQTQTFEDLPADTVFLLHEEKGVIERRPIATRQPTRLAADSRASVQKQTFFAKVRKAPRFEDTDLDGRQIRADELYRNPTLVSFVKGWLPEFDEHLELLEAIDADHPELQVVVILVEPVDDDVVEQCRKHRLRFIRAPYARYAPAFAQQTNVLFPSTFLIRGGDIVFDMIGRLDETSTKEAVSEKLR